ncbi:outer membrane protein [Microvirga antarctica]|uniref:outer membrane protein n=1 Tax=Microvirga antarctica TaxID=2819233 RepID=UPI001B309C91|nr:outer membrane protein [Microvirga antarctica]
MKKLLLASVAIFGFAGAAAAADLPSRYAPPPMVAAIPVFTWTGFYVGVNAGYGWNTSNNNNAFYNGVGYYGSNSNDGGFVGGGQVGYNYQMGQFVLGLETDIQYADIGGGNNNYAFNGIYGGNGGSDGYFGTVRARAGFAIDRALIYVTGGFAYGDVGTTASNFGYSSNSSTNTGWVLGGGVEYAFTNNLTAKIEGLYVNLGSKNDYGYAGVAPIAVYDYSKKDNEFGVIRAGLNYKFSSY